MARAVCACCHSSFAILHPPLPFVHSLCASPSAHNPYRLSVATLAVEKTSNALNPIVFDRIVSGDVIPFDCIVSGDVTPWA